MPHPKVLVITNVASEATLVIMASVHQVFVFHYDCDQNYSLDHKLKESELENKENKHGHINKRTV